MIGSRSAMVGSGEGSPMKTPWIVLFLSLAAMNSPSLVRAQSPIQTWAIVTEPGLDAVVFPAVTNSAEEESFSDLLTAKLTENGLSLVERDRLNLIEDEQLLQQLFAKQGGEAAASKFGRQIHADALILVAAVDTEETQKQETSAVKSPPSLRISVYSGQQAARLGFLVVQRDKAIQTIDPIVDSILEIRQQFRNGVRYSLGVSPFAAKNLEKQFDDLGESFHDLLTQSLDLEPGVAIVDFERARWIAKELDSDQGLRERVIPWVVEVEYQVASSPPESPGLPRIPQTIEFVARRISGDKIESYQSPPLPMDQAPEWISRTLVRQLLDQKGKESTLDLESQLRLLLERADRYALLGDFERAIESRESLLMLHPKNFDERLKLLDDYSALASLLTIESNPFRKNPSTNVRKKASHVRRQALENLEWLIVAEHLDAKNAYERLEYWCQYHGGLNLPTFYWLTRPEFREVNDERFHEDARRMRSLKVPFLASIERGSYSAKEKLEFQTKWSALVWSTLTMRMDQKYYHAPEVERLFRAAIAATPASFPTTYHAGVFLRSPAIHVYIRDMREGTSGEHHFIREEGELTPVYSAWLREEHPHFKFYAQLASLWADSGPTLHKVAYPEYIKGPKEFTESDVEKAQKWIVLATEQIEEISQRPNATESIPFYKHQPCDFVLSRLLEIRGELAKVASGPRAPKMEDNRLASLTAPTTGRMVFEPVSWDLTEYHQHQFRILPGSREFDFIVGSTSIVRVDKNESLTRIHAYSYNPTRSVLWDGARLLIWNSAKPTEEWKLLDSAGTQVAVIDPAATFPPFESLSVFPVAPNQWLVVGNLENGTRSWCALWDVGMTERRVRVFHEARRPVASRVGDLLEQQDLELDWTIHSKTWVGKYVHEGKEFLLIPRAGVCPLTVDLESLQVSALAISRGNAPGKPICIDGKLLFAFHDAWSYDLSAQNGPWLERRRVIPWENGDNQNIGIFAAGNYDGMIFEHEGWIYLPGYAWHRFDRKLEKIERLVPTRLPHEFGQLKIVKSDVFGILGYSSRDEYDSNSKSMPAIYRIKVKDPE